MALITISDIEAVREVSGVLQNSGKAIKLTQSIADAEMSDLRDLVGEELWYDINNRPTAIDKGSYPDLLNGSSYEWLGYNYSHPGIKAVLIDFAYSRYRFFGNDTDTAFGFVEKQYKDGRNTDYGRNREVYTSIRKVAMDKWKLVRLYLDRMNGTENRYSLWFHPGQDVKDDNDSIVINKVTLY